MFLFVGTTKKSKQLVSVKPPTEVTQKRRRKISKFVAAAASAYQLSSNTPNVAYPLMARVRP
jgi:hypothetical protein